MALKLQDLIDIEQFQFLQDRLNRIYSFPSAIIDNDGNILTATAWQDVCTKFHRQHPEAAKECVKSDQYILSHIHEARPSVSYECPHGLIDNATPIIIDGVHYGNFFTGQFFLEPPDLNVFRAQAKKYGFDEEAFIEAVKRVPIWSREQVSSYLYFIKGLIEVISGIGRKNLKEIETRKQMQESEERFRAILHTALDGFWLTDMQGRLLEVNDAYCRMSGYSAPELLTKSISDLECAESADDTAAHIRKIIARGEDRFESRHRRKDGSVLEVEISAQFRPTDDGQIVAFLRDITERRRAEEKLDERNRYIETILENSPIGFAVNTVKDGKAAFIAGKFEDVYGVPRGSIHSVEDYFEKVYLDPVFREEIRARMMADMATGDASQMRWEDLPITTPAGEKKFVTAINIPLPDQNLMVSTVQDVTERRRTEDEKAALEAQLQQAQKMESVGRLAGGVAHDFNNMLGVILGHTELAIEMAATGMPLLGDLEEIRRAAERSSDLTRQLLAFARKQTVAPKVLDPNDAVTAMLRMLQRLIGEDIHLAWRPGVGVWPVKMDPSQLDQVMTNLCVNARDAIAGVGKVTIETANISFDEDYCADHAGFAAGDYVLIAVSDDGCGMDRATLDKIFEPFFTTKGVKSGTGLGLATVYGVVKQNHGFINVYSEVGQGTTFKLYLPRHTGESRQARKLTPQEPISRGRETILLVEDEPALLELNTLLLEKQGYRVLPAATPREAIRLAEDQSEKIHLLMTDVVMPEMNGRELAARVVSLHPTIRCLFTSGYTANVIAHHGVLDDGVHFIQKPFSRTELAAKVREALE